MNLPAHSTPILEVIAWLRDSRVLTAGECKQFIDGLPIAYRTFGDLRHIIGRDEIEKGLAKKLEQVLR